VANGGDAPVVDHDDGVGGVVGDVVVGEVVEQAPAAAAVAQVGEGERVPAALGEEVAAEAEHVRPPAEPEGLVVGSPPSCQAVSIMRRWWSLMSR